MKTNSHTVSVIIPTVGRATLAQCQAALQKQTRPSDEVITVIDHERRGVSWARNEGFRQSRGDLITFADDDAVPPPDWLERLITALDERQADAVGGTYLETDPFLHEVRQLRPMPEVVQEDTHGWVGNGGNIVIKRSLLEQCVAQDGYIYHEGIPAGEDWELVWRLRLRGAKLVYVPINVTHLRRVMPLNYCRHQFMRGVGIALLYRFQRRVKSDLRLQESLIWGPGHGRAKWLWAVGYKVIGPFNWRRFSRAKHFWTHWLAEKVQCVGFLWGLLWYVPRLKSNRSRG